MAEYIPNWKGLEAYHFTGSNQAEITEQAQKNGGSTYTDNKGNFFVVIGKTEYFLPPNYVLVINEQRAGKLYKKADFDIKYKDYTGGGGGGSGTEITAGEGIKVSATGEVSVDFDILAKKEDLDKNVFVAVYNQTTAQELLDYLVTTNKPYAPIVVERGGQYYTAILSFKQNEETAYIRVFGSVSGEYTIFNHTIKGNVWGTETTTLQKKIDLNQYYTKNETDTKIADGIAGFDKLDYKIVDTLPETGDAGVRYLIKTPKKKSFEEWIYINDEWHNIGTTSDVNLENYYTKAETEVWVNEQGFLKEHQDLSAYAKTADVNSALSLKADKTELSDYATEVWVNEQGFLKEHQDLSGYATQTWVEGKGYLIEHQDLSDYAKTNDVNSALDLKADKTELNGLATENWVNAQNFLKEHQDLSDYATETWVENKGYLTEHQDLSSYATEAWVNAQNFLKEHQDLSNYYNKTETAEKIAEELSNFDKLDYKIVDTLPTQGELGVRYLVKDSTNNKFEEWIFVDNTWYDVGSTDTVNLENYYNKTEADSLLNDKADKTELSDYATEAWVENKGYLTEHQDLSAYAKTADVNSALNLKADKTQLNGLATESWVEAKNYLTEHQDLSTYATKEYVNESIILGRMGLAYKDDVDADIDNLILTKQDKLTAGEGITIDTSTNTISADISSAFKFVQKNANGITIPANTRTNVIVADILEVPYQIAGFRQIGILKGDGGDDFGWKQCVIQSYSTTNGGKSAQVQVRNTGATEAIINVSVNVLAFKTA